MACQWYPDLLCLLAQHLSLQDAVALSLVSKQTHSCLPEMLVVDRTNTSEACTVTLPWTDRSSTQVHLADRLPFTERETDGGFVKRRFQWCTMGVVWDFAQDVKRCSQAMLTCPSSATGSFLLRNPEPSQLPLLHPTSSSPCSSSFDIRVVYDSKKTESRIEALCAVLQNDMAAITSLTITSDAPLTSTSVLTLANAIRRNSTLEHIRIHNSSCGDDLVFPVIVDAFKQHSRLNDVAFYHFQTKEQVETIARAIDEQHQWQTLSLCDVQIVGETIATLLAAPLSRSHLQTLDLSATALEDDGFEAVANMLAHNTTIKTLDLSLSSCTEHAADHFARALSLNSTLQVLHLYFAFVDCVATSAFLSSYPVASSVTTLTLTSSDIGDESAHALGRLLSANPQLKILSLNRTQLGASQLEPIVAALASNVVLHTLRLDENDFDVECMEHLASSLRVNRSIRTLSLCDCKIPPAGIALLMDAIGRDSSLLHLSLSANPLEYTGVAAIAQALALNPSITTLQLDQVMADDAACNELAEALSINRTLTTLSLLRNFEMSEMGIMSLADGIASNQTLRCLCLDDVYDIETKRVVATKACQTCICFKLSKQKFGF
eukprot:m.264423 g.264423  ORF g.264423 m.264423 type:complete len:606 (+) comp15612_c0_seq17:145-1962(+)